MRKRTVSQETQSGTAPKRRRYRCSLPDALLVCMIVIGICLMVYPSFGSWWNRRSASQSIDEYRASVEVMTEEEKAAMIQEAVDYNERLARKGQTFRLTPQELAEYNSILDITGTGIMGYVRVPKADIELPIYHTTDDAVLQIAAGHFAGTSFPVGGSSVHAVISGHRGLPSAKLFTDIAELEIGDIFTVTVLDRVRTYEIDRIRIVVPRDTSELLLADGKDYCTLQTCTPYGVNTHRLLLRGHRIDSAAAALVQADGRATRIPYYYVAPAIAIPILLLIRIIVLLSHTAGVCTKRQKKA